MMGRNSDSDRNESANIFFGNKQSSDTESEDSARSDDNIFREKEQAYFFTNHHCKDDF